MLHQLTKVQYHTYFFSQDTKQYEFLNSCLAKSLAFLIYLLSSSQAMAHMTKKRGRGEIQKFEKEKNLENEKSLFKK